MQRNSLRKRRDKYCPKIEGKVNSFQELVLRPIETCHQTVQNYEGEERDKDQEGWSPEVIFEHEANGPGHRMVLDSINLTPQKIRTASS